MADPTHLSVIPAGTDVSAYDVGLGMLGQGPTEQGRLLAGVLEARDEDELPLYPTTGVLMPRRSTKTTAIWAVLLGRCATREGHKVVTTAQDGKRARNRWAEVMRAVEPRADELGIKIRRGNGDEAFEWENGSRLWVVSPQAGSFRGEAADDMLFDEAGELSLERSADLLAGALPLLDTRPMGQAIVAGTPAKARAGLLWDTLEDARRGEPATGIVDYSVRDDEASVLPADEAPAEWVRSPDGLWALNEDVLRRVHPGIGTLTTMAKMRSRFTKMQLPQFEMEYLCRFPTSNATSAIDEARWAAAAVAPVERAGRVGIAFDCAYDGSSASIAYAWRDEHGNAYGEVVAHRAGTSWVARAAKDASAKNGRTAVAYDDIGANRDPVAALVRMKPVPKTDRLALKDIMGASQRLVSEITEGRFRHFGQPDLDAAVSNATWRDVQRSGRAFGAKVAAGPSINPLVAVSLALWSYDKARDRKPLTIVA